MRGPLKDFCTNYLNEIADQPQLMELYLKTKWEGFVSGDDSYPWNYFWHWIVLAYWMEENKIEW
jgi:hypothetical protein